jgi:hypothetical protein
VRELVRRLGATVRPMQRCEKRMSGQVADWLCVRRGAETARVEEWQTPGCRERSR